MDSEFWFRCDEGHVKHVTLGTLGVDLSLQDVEFSLQDMKYLFKFLQGCEVLFSALTITVGGSGRSPSILDLGLRRGLHFHGYLIRNLRCFYYYHVVLILRCSICCRLFRGVSARPRLRCYRCGTRRQIKEKGLWLTSGYHRWCDHRLSLTDPAVSRVLGSFPFRSRLRRLWVDTADAFAILRLRVGNVLTHLAG